MQQKMKIKEAFIHKNIMCTSEIFFLNFFTYLFHFINADMDLIMTFNEWDCGPLIDNFVVNSSLHL